ncbi:LytTR family transcriptional regulator [Vibrio sp. DW001]|uniref:LytR/AlgR family response regulator transcription factor n=1 Tax=Vibrio sp. DW001 TaxID=2912315 RepID=UPI0023B16CBF|nr:LytTR family DNA-binding domain-containing protein [Vibrio sp. DW001]WED25487.1 LytTR family transcriptional regulator [Vibrio sp. DW001]
MMLLKTIEKRPQLFIFLFFSFYIIINNTINATSIIMEALRSGGELSFPFWSPFLSEYSSAVGFMLALPLIAILLNKFPLTWLFYKKNLIWHFIGSILFSLIHVSLMVLIRKIIFYTQGIHYQFGDISLELFYEYRKDAWLYVFFVLYSYSFNFVISRMIGEAKLVDEGEDEPVQQSIDRLLIRKLGKEFIVKIDDIEWLESSGNYVNLHIKERVYPIRATLGGLIEQISDRGFCRIHRSYGINLDEVESITPQPSGDAEIKLKNGKRLNLSRHYKDSFRMKLG